jgi:L-aminopeptidase/D-esterase-like protein
VILCQAGAVAGVDVRGSAPGTRETDLLSPVNSIQKVHALLLSGGSAYGLDAATGVMRYLEEMDKGLLLDGRGVIPIVPTAVLMDLGFGDFKIRPDAEAGYRACLAASTALVPEGNVGAGAGATVGKMFGSKYWMKGGIGGASMRIADTEIVIGAVAVVNALGDVVNPRNGEVLAGARTVDGKGLRNTMKAIIRGELSTVLTGGNTTLGVVATNAPFNKSEMSKIAQMAHDGFARSINPVHTAGDGDTIFALSTSQSSGQVDVSTVGSIAAEVMARSVIRAVLLADSLLEFNLPSARYLAGL